MINDLAERRIGVPASLREDIAGERGGHEVATELQRRIKSLVERVALITRRWSAQRVGTSGWHVKKEANMGLIERS